MFAFTLTEIGTSSWIRLAFVVNKKNGRIKKNKYSEIRNMVFLVTLMSKTYVLQV
jgi:hypothetical protein